MKQEFYAGMAYTGLPLFTLLLFIAMFVGVLVWVLVLRRRSDFDAVARLPLADGTPPVSAAPRAPGAAQRGTP